MISNDSVIGAYPVDVVSCLFNLRIHFGSCLAISHYMLYKYPGSCNSEHCDFYEVNHYDLITAFENNGAVKC